MHTLKRWTSRGGRLFAALSFTLALIAPAVVSNPVFAVGQFTSRKLTMSSQALGTQSTDTNGNTLNPGDGGNGAKAVHTFNFTIATTGNEGSYSFQYCTTPLFGTTCTAPTGLDASTITSVASQSGFAGGSWTIDTTTVANAGTVFTAAPCSGSSPYRQNCILVKRTAASETAPLAVSLSFGTGGGTNYIKNPTSAGSFYVRITSYSDNAYTTIVDQAAVAGSANTSIDITAKVQEKLNFSVSGTWSTPNATCDALTGSGSVTLGDSNGVLDYGTQYDQHTYFRLNTNAQNGTSVLYSGDTLKTSGGNVIPALSSLGTTTAAGTAGFGLGLDSGDTGKYSFTNLTATSPYGAANGALGSASFAYNTSSVTTPVEIASAASGTTVQCDTGSVRYIGNIATTTKAGIYRTLISYIAVPTF